MLFKTLQSKRDFSASDRAQHCVIRRCQVDMDRSVAETGLVLEKLVPLWEESLKHHQVSEALETSAGDVMEGEFRVSWSVFLGL